MISSQRLWQLDHEAGPPTDVYVLILQSKLNVERNNPLYLVSWDILAITEEISITFDISKSIHCL